MILLLLYLHLLHPNADGKTHDLLYQLYEMIISKMILFDWEIKYRFNAICNMISARQGYANVVGARKTDVVTIDTDSARTFLDANHLQGFGRGSIYTGLVYNNKLVAVSAWLQINNVFELNRLAFDGIVIGGFAKLLKAFRQDIKAPIISFLDPRYATGNSYKDLNFTDAGETNHPVYYYVGPGGLYHRRLFTRDGIRSRLSFFDDNITEQENARINGYYRVYG